MLLGFALFACSTGLAQNVSVATVTPHEKLEINGNLLLPPGSRMYVGGRTNLGEQGLQLHHTSGNAFFDLKGLGNINFRIDNTDGSTAQMCILQNGNV